MSEKELRENAEKRSGSTEKRGSAETGDQRDDDINEKMYGSFDYGDLNPPQSVLLTFLISFVTGILTASFVLFIYLHYIKPPPLRYYRFDLSKVMSTVERKIMKNGKDMSRDDIKATIDSYISAIGSYVNFYAGKGIVFVGGATIGNSPFVIDITGGFYDYYRAIRKK